MLPIRANCLWTGTCERRTAGIIETLARAQWRPEWTAFFLETHDNPAAALSDGANALPLAQLPALLARLKKWLALCESGMHPGA